MNATFSDAHSKSIETLLEKTTKGLSLSSSEVTELLYHYLCKKQTRQEQGYRVDLPNSAAT